jgi:hypothetical protein
MSLGDFIVWAQSLVSFISDDVIDRDSEHYVPFKDILSVVKFFRAAKKASFYENVSRVLTTKGKCFLHGKATGAEVHPSTEVFCFFWLKGKVQLSTAAAKLKPGDLECSNADFRFYHEIITLEGKPGKGKELPSSTVKDGLKWAWNDALVKEFVSHVKALAADNEMRKSLHYTTTRHDVFFFPDLTLSDFGKSEHPKETEEGNVVVSTVRRGVDPRSVATSRPYNNGNTVVDHLDYIGQILGQSTAETESNTDIVGV